MNRKSWACCSFEFGVALVRSEGACSGGASPGARCDDARAAVLVGREVLGHLAITSN